MGALQRIVKLGEALQVAVDQAAWGEVDRVNQELFAQLKTVLADGQVNLKDEQVRAQLEAIAVVIQRAEHAVSQQSNEILADLRKIKQAGPRLKAYLTNE